MRNKFTALVAVFLLLISCIGPVYAAKIMPGPVARFFDSNGDPLSSGKVYTYEAGTSTPKTTYTDSTENTSNANPVILDADGEANIWLGSGAYKIVLKDSNDATQWTVDNILGDTTVGFGQSVTDVSASTAVTTAHENTFFNCSSSPTLSLPAVADVDNFIFGIRNTSTGTCTLDPNSTELINGASTLTIDRSETAIVYSDGSAWFTLAHINILDQDTMSSNSDTAVPTQQSVKAYVDTTAAATPPPGTVIFYAGTTEPTGYLFAYGQAISRTTYAALFTAISTTYGVGDGSTTFNVPDCRGRVIAGQDDMGGSSANRLTDAVTESLNGDTLGDTGGEETHTMTVSEMPAHTHTITTRNTFAQTGATDAATTTSPNGSMNTGSSGSGTAFNQVQPTIILNCLIKT